MTFSLWSPVHYKPNLIKLDITRNTPLWALQATEERRPQRPGEGWLGCLQRWQTYSLHPGPWLCLFWKKKLPSASYKYLFLSQKTGNIQVILDVFFKFLKGYIKIHHTFTPWHTLQSFTCILKRGSILGVYVYFSICVYEWETERRFCIPEQARRQTFGDPIPHPHKSASAVTTDTLTHNKSNSCINQEHRPHHSTQSTSAPSQQSPTQQCTEWHNITQLVQIWLLQCFWWGKYSLFICRYKNDYGTHTHKHTHAHTRILTLSPSPHKTQPMKCKYGKW